MVSGDNPTPPRMVEPFPSCSGSLQVPFDPVVDGFLEAGRTTKNLSTPASESDLSALVCPEEWMRADHIHIDAGCLTHRNQCPTTIPARNSPPYSL